MYPARKIGKQKYKKPGVEKVKQADDAEKEPEEGTGEKEGIRRKRGEERAPSQS